MTDWGCELDADVNRKRKSPWEGSSSRRLSDQLAHGLVWPEAFPSEPPEPALPWTRCK